MIVKNNLLILWFLASLSALAYKPETSPELYRDKADLSPKSSFARTGLYGGTLASFGQSFAEKKADGDPKITYNFGIEFGYRNASKNWTFWEVGTEISRGESGYSSAKIKNNLDVALRLGYGFYLSESLYGIFHIGPVLVVADYSGKDSNGVKFESTDANIGIGAFIGYDLSFEITDRFHTLIGARWRYNSVSFEKIENANNDSTSKTVSSHAVEVKLGLRYII